MRSAAAYASGYAVQRAIGFLLLPFYTRAVTPSEYGALSVLVAAASAMYFVFTLGVEPAIFRLYFQFGGDAGKQRRLIDTLWRFLIAFPIAGALVLSVIAWPFVHHLRLVDETDVFLMLMGAAMLVSGTAVPLALLRAEQRLRDYLAITSVATITAPALTVIFVVALDLGVRGFLLATLLANVLVLVAAWFVIPWSRGGEVDRPLLRSAIVFGLPLLPHTLSHWALQLADRAVIAGIVSSASLGIYGLASNVAIPVMVVLQSLNQGFMPIYAKAGAEPEGSTNLRRIVVLQVVLVAIGCLGGTLLAPPLLEIITPSSYRGAGSLVAWIVLGYGFLGLYYIPMNGATLGAGRSRFAWIATATSAATNIALLLLLVPSHGVHAAAVASAIGYGVLLVTIFAYAHARPNPVKYDWRAIVSTIVLALLVYVLAQVTSPDNEWLTLLVHGAWLAVFPCALAVLGVFSVGSVLPMFSLRGRSTR